MARLWRLRVEVGWPGTYVCPLVGLPAPVTFKKRCVTRFQCNTQWTIFMIHKCCVKYTLPRRDLFLGADAAIIRFLLPYKVSLKKSNLTVTNLSLKVQIKSSCNLVSCQLPFNSYHYFFALHFTALAFGLGTLKRLIGTLLKMR